MRFPVLLWLAALLLGTGVLAAKEPVVSKRAFDGKLFDLLFFEDSEVALVADKDNKIVYQSEYREGILNWTPVKGVPEGDALVVYKHPYDNKVAIILGRKKVHWITKDQGKTWKSFETAGVVNPRNPIQFHASDSNRYLFQGDEECNYWTCRGTTWYTTDAFETPAKLLHKHRIDCMWAKSYDRFTTGDEAQDKNLIMCILEGKHSEDAKDYRLVMTSDYFEEDEHEPAMADGRTVAGMANLAAVKGYIVAAAKSSERSTELSLYVTDDTKTWHRAEFGRHRIEEDAYTILESTNYSIQVDVKTTQKAEVGMLFSSNSNGTFFTQNIDHTNRNEAGIVDFEKVQNIQGIVMVNVVDNWEEVERMWLAEKELKTKISFDDGRSWESMRTKDDDTLHLHSVTNQQNTGRIFSSPAPGIVMGVGNTGKRLGKYSEGDLYVSEDAGMTWFKAREEAHKYEFGGQGSILVAIYDEGETDELWYSTDHGRKWKSVGLGEKVRAYELTTVPDSTIYKFLLKATVGRGGGAKYHLFTIDFTDLLPKCKDDDMEKWWARKDEKGEPACLMGHKQYFYRRKQDAECFVGNAFQEELPHSEPCECTKADFECDFNFRRVGESKGDKLECELAGGAALSPGEGQCKSGDESFKGPSGYRLIPGDDCKRADGKQIDDKVERPCSETKTPITVGDIAHKRNDLRSKFVEYFYLERHAEGGDDETVVALTQDSSAHISRDHGKTWKNPLPKGSDESVVAIYPHQYFDDSVYFITPSKTVYYSHDRGDSVHSFTAPEAPNQNRVQILGFHPEHRDWLLWVGGKDCGASDTDCHTVAHVSTKDGEEWHTLLRFVQKCIFVYRRGHEKLIYCEQHQDDNPSAPLQLMSSEDWFESKTTLFEDIVNFATMSEFIVVAQKTDDRKYLKLQASIDGSDFASARFPPKFDVPHQEGYTVLDSSTHAIFLHVTVNNAQGQEYGTIIKSNSNGTSYVLSLSGVNRNRAGYVDFEKMVGLEGVAIVNIVDNTKEVDGGTKKKLKTKITHNDGADWSLMKPPVKDSDGKSYGCAGGSLEKCALHLHGYTERDDPRDTYASQSAIGLMMGVGNVGEYLKESSDEDTETFVTRDGGVTWETVMRGRFHWEYGDQGSIIVIVPKSRGTNHVLYSRDEGRTWKKYEFSESDIEITDITTLPSDNSRQFLLWGRDFNINLDFRGLTSRMCHLDTDDPEASDSDYTLWTPKHPMQDDECLFGHIARYYRKKPEADCYNGKNFDKLHGVPENCTCSRADFECDYNYEKQNDGSCALVSGLSPPDKMAICKENPLAVEYYDPTGYRKIPISTCQGGQEFELTAPSHPCPGHEPEYERKHGIGGIALFFAVVLPVAAAAGVGYWVWRNWEGKFGQIRLGDGMGGGAFDGDSPFVKWPVAVLSGVVAVLAAVPLVVGSLWKAVMGRFGRGGGGGGGGGGRTYRSREAFARGRGDYAAVDVQADEGELLGEDSDEEV